MTIEKQAVIVGGKVVNTVIVDTSDQPENTEQQTYVSCAENPRVSNGWSWDGTTFTPPEYIESTDDQIKAGQKEEAKRFLAETDWLATVDVQDQLTTESSSAWITYRTMLRTYLGSGSTEYLSPDQPEIAWKE
tara:strand:+ start:1019 stop:1417 length:399 start_codon:yes stop_codon:yes gene_type:complete